MGRCRLYRNREKPLLAEYAKPSFGDSGADFHRNRRTG